jgi:hypothetical protein
MSPRKTDGAKDIERRPCCKPGSGKSPTCIYIRSIAPLSMPNRAVPVSGKWESPATCIIIILPLISYTYTQGPQRDGTFSEPSSYRKSSMQRRRGLSQQALVVDGAYLAIDHTYTVIQKLSAAAPVSCTLSSCSLSCSIAC